MRRGTAGRRRWLLLAVVAVSLVGCSPSNEGAQRAAAVQRRAQEAGAPETPAAREEHGPAAKDAPSGRHDSPRTGGTGTGGTGTGGTGAAGTGPAADPTPPARAGTAVEAGVFRVEVDEVGDDGAGDLQITARVRNAGTDTRGATLTAYLFLDGTVVGTATGTVAPLAPGEEVGTTFRGLTDYTDEWDDLTFQVDAEFGGA